MLEQCTTRLARFFTTKRFKAFNISSLQSVSTNQINDTMAQDAEHFHLRLRRLSLSSAGTGTGRMGPRRYRRYRPRVPPTT